MHENYVCRAVDCRCVCVLVRLWVSVTTEFNSLVSTRYGLSVERFVVASLSVNAVYREVVEQRNTFDMRDICIWRTSLLSLVNSKALSFPASQHQSVNQWEWDENSQMLPSPWIINNKDWSNCKWSPDSTRLDHTMKLLRCKICNSHFHSSLYENEHRAVFTWNYLNIP